MSLSVYLAYAIDQAKAPDPTPKHLIDDLASCDQVSWVFNPGGAFRPGLGGRDSGIQDITTSALDRADALVAWLPAGTASIGVPIEIDRAARSGKPTLLLSDAPSWSLQYDGGHFERWERYRGRVELHEWVSRALRGVSERTRALGGTLMPYTLAEGAKAPQRAYADDAGLDLVVSDSRVINPGEFVDVPCGVSVELPAHTWGMITGRSSTLRKRGLLVNQGVIDAGWRGELFAGVWNLTDQEVWVEQGERLAQLIILENATRLVDPIRVVGLGPGSRGTNGFGSSGL